ncbi:hypothetical protein ABZ897_27410 [Nonomuraea sp. NPDC046802]|uniref:hypothetical protein n=1 Tax=Nonomuraea sp. NPDC046802 TaxID=3154919 RepID=UPI0033C48720
MSVIRNIDLARLADIIPLTDDWPLDAPTTVRLNKLPAAGGARRQVKAVLAAARDDGMIVQMDEEDTGFRKAEFTVLMYGSGQQVIDTLRALALHTDPEHETPLRRRVTEALAS